MEKAIEFKNTGELFIEYLKTQKMTKDNTYLVNKNELKKFFEFETKDEFIEVSLSDFYRFHKCSFLGENFFFSKQ